MSNKSTKQNGKFKQDQILSQFGRDAKRKPSTESAVALAKRNARLLKPKTEEVRVSYLQLSINKTK